MELLGQQEEIWDLEDIVGQAGQPAAGRHATKQLPACQPAAGKPTASQQLANRRHTPTTTNGG